jgi:hypothetical protein
MTFVKTDANGSRDFYNHVHFNCHKLVHKKWNVDHPQHNINPRLPTTNWQQVKKNKSCSINIIN